MTAPVLAVVASVAAVVAASRAADGARPRARRHPGTAHPAAEPVPSASHPRPGTRRAPHGAVAWPRPRRARPWRSAPGGRTGSFDQPAHRPIAPGPSNGAVALVAAILFPLAPPAALLLPAATWLHRRRRTILVTTRAQRAVRRALPDVVDLLVLTTSAGLSLPLAHPLVASQVEGPLADALGVAAAAATAGRPRADALLDALAPLGPGATRVGHALADHLRYGTPLAPSLERLGAELRLDRRREAEQEARRVPVRLLGPLVACVLPAFALLTVVPLLAASLRALPT